MIAAISFEIFMKQSQSFYQILHCALLVRNIASRIYCVCFSSSFTNRSDEQLWSWDAEVEVVMILSFAFLFLRHDISACFPFYFINSCLSSSYLYTINSKLDGSEAVRYWY